jgi:hypothetical protein
VPIGSQALQKSPADPFLLRRELSGAVVRLQQVAETGAVVAVE